MAPSQPSIPSRARGPRAAQTFIHGSRYGPPGPEYPLQKTLAILAPCLSPLPHLLLTRGGGWRTSPRPPLRLLPPPSSIRVASSSCGCGGRPLGALLELSRGAWSGDGAERGAAARGSVWRRAAACRRGAGCGGSSAPYSPLQAFSSGGKAAPSSSPTEMSPRSDKK